jgi:hypothetical protein
VEHSVDQAEITISDSVQVVGIYVVANDPAMRQAITTRHAELVREEADVGFDPGRNEHDLQRLKALFRRNG